MLMLGGGGALLLLLLAGVAIGGYYILRPSSPRSTSTAPAIAQAPNPSVQAVQTAVPASSSQTPAVNPVPAPGPGLPPAAGPGGGTIPAAVLQQIKEATVFVKVEAGGDSGSGSGFVMLTQGETAYVATNNHVVTPDPEEVVIRRGRVYRVAVSQPVTPVVSLVFNSGTPRRADRPL